MKKLKNLLFIIVMGVIVCMPFGAKALGANQVDLRMVKVDKDCSKTANSDGKCTFKANIIISTGSSVSNFAGIVGTLNLSSGIDKTSVTFTDQNDFKTTYTSANNTISISRNEAISAGTTDLVMTTITGTVSATADCSITLSPTGYETIKVEIKEETTNSKTGVSLPFIALGGIALGALAIYVVSSKKTKIHKI